MRTTPPPNAKEDGPGPLSAKIGWPGGEGPRWRNAPPMPVGPFKKTLGSARQLTLGLPVPPSSVEYKRGRRNRTIHTPFFSFYKRASCAPPKASPALKSGSYVPIDRNNPSVLFLSSVKSPGGSDSILVVLNMTGEQRTLTFDLTPLWNQPEKFKEAASSLAGAGKCAATQFRSKNLTVQPFGVYIGALH